MISGKTLRAVLPSDRAVALWGGLIRAAAAAAVVFLIALWGLYYVAVVRFMYTTLHMNDFGKFYYSARLTALTSIAIAAVTFGPLARNPRAFPLDHAFVLTLLVAQLVSPLGWVYYLWLGAGPFVAVARQWWTNRSRLRDFALWLAVPGLVVPMQLTIVELPSGWLAPSLRSIYT